MAYQKTGQLARNGGSTRTLKGHILVMDDDENVRLGLCAILERMGNTVVSARDGGEALEAYRASLAKGAPFQAVILDLTIPGGVGGAEVLKRLFALDPQVRGIVCSGYATNPVMSNHEHYGFKAVLRKPFGESQLKKVLNTVLSEA